MNCQSSKEGNLYRTSLYDLKKKIKIKTTPKSLNRQTA